MSKIVWDAVGERKYETGVKHGVLYPRVGNAYPKGVGWNGLTSVDISPEGGEANDIWADDTKYLSLRSKENCNGTINAYMYPDEFAECDGSKYVVPGVKIGQQTRKPFGFSFVSTIGNDTEFEDYGFILHLIWGATVSPSQRTYTTINDNPEASELSWEFDTTPVEIGTIEGIDETFKPLAHMEIHSTDFTETAAKAKFDALMEVLYGKDPTTAGGNDGVDPRLPMPKEVIEMLM